MSATYTVGPTLAPEEAPWPLMWEQNPKGLTVEVADVMEVGMAAGNGYLWTAPTSRAFRRVFGDEDGATS